MIQRGQLIQISRSAGPEGVDDVIILAVSLGIDAAAQWVAVQHTASDLLLQSKLPTEQSSYGPIICGKCLAGSFGKPQ